MQKTEYYCDNCKNKQEIHLTDIENNKIYHNGLRVKTNLHTCEEGILKVRNLHIDKDNNIRTSERLEFPKLDKPKQKLINSLPTPRSLKSTREERKIFQISNIVSTTGFRLLLEDEILKIQLNVGNVMKSNEDPLFTVSSSLNTIRFRYYPSMITPNEHTKDWFNKFVNLIEILPPTNLGQILLCLRYILQICTEPVTEEDITKLEMILNSPNITFKKVKDFEPNLLLDKNGMAKYEASTVKKIIDLLTYIELHPNQSLQEYTTTHMSDLIYLIRLFLILEENELIEIQKPKTLKIE